MLRSMPTIAVADETDACFDTNELREREREVERGRRSLPNPRSLDHVGSVSLFRKTWVVKKPKSVSPRAILNGRTTTTGEVGRRHDGGLYDDHPPPPPQERQDNRRDRRGEVTPTGPTGGEVVTYDPPEGGGGARRRGRGRGRAASSATAVGAFRGPPTARARVSPSLSVD